MKDNNKTIVLCTILEIIILGVILGYFIISMKGTLIKLNQEI